MASSSSWDSGFWLLSRRTFLMVLWFCSLSASEDVTMDTESWLRQYGYLAPRASTDSSSMFSAQDLSEAISDMQRFYSLEVTGQMDQQTITAMKRPRCGVPDKTTNAGQSANYKMDGDRWNKHHLTYSIENFAPNMAWYETCEAIRRAFKVWEKASPLTFEEISFQEIHYRRRDKADIMISFASGSHGCEPFRSTTLAHAFSPGPGKSGDVHFNSEVPWSVANQNVPGSINLFLIAVHELGHSLGLDHSSDQSSIMYRYYQWMETEDFQLPADDRQGIQHIYGGHPIYSGFGTESCPSGWKKFGSSCYYRSTERKPWQQSREECLNQGADLVVISSREELEFIRGLGPEDWPLHVSWIGLKRTDRGGRWTWVDGKPLTTQYWYSGHPVNNEDLNCAVYFHYTDPGTLSNTLCSFKAPTICEK